MRLPAKAARAQTDVASHQQGRRAEEIGGQVIGVRGVPEETGDSLQVGKDLGTLTRTGIVDATLSEYDCLLVEISRIQWGEMCATQRVAGRLRTATAARVCNAGSRNK
jgi:hypothetical protein